MNVAVTGGLGTGKSTVSKILAATLATELIDTDELCRLQMLPGAEGFDKFRHTFGERFIQDDGTIDRLLLKQEVFDNGELRAKLESILHPIVQLQVAARSEVSSSRGDILIVEVPLLYEVGWQDRFDICVVVYVPEELCLQRVMARDGILVKQVKQILDAQFPIKKKLDNAHFIVDNSGTFVSTVQQIAWLSQKLNEKLSGETKE